MFSGGKQLSRGGVEASAFYSGGLRVFASSTAVTLSFFCRTSVCQGFHPNESVKSIFYFFLWCLEVSAQGSVTQRSQAKSN